MRRSTGKLQHLLPLCVASPLLHCCRWFALCSYRPECPTGWPCCPPAVAALDKQQLSALLEGPREKDTFVALYAPWCRFCKVGQRGAPAAHAAAAAATIAWVLWLHECLHCNLGYRLMRQRLAASSNSGIA